jgi:hypothetical protein
LPGRPETPAGATDDARERDRRRRAAQLTPPARATDAAAERDRLTESA